MTANLIDDVAEKVEAHFKRLVPYQDQVEHLRGRAFEEEQSYFHRLSQMTEDQRAAEIAKLQEKGRDSSEQQRVIGEVSRGIAEQLNRLTPDTYPRGDPETPRRMHEFLGRTARAYSRPGKVRGAAAVLEYLLSSNYDHAFWLHREWTAACLAVGDFEGASALIAAATDGHTPAAHKFATQAGAYHPSTMVASALIALHRDGDLPKALEIAHKARDQFGESRDAVGLARRLSQLKELVDDGHLRITGHMDREGREYARLTRTVPPVALLTGQWDGPKQRDDEPRGRPGKTKGRTRRG